MWQNISDLLSMYGEPENGAYLIPRLPKPGSGNGIWEATLTSVL